MQRKKKELERFYFDSFVPKVSDFPTGKVDPDDSPDFLIEGPGYVLGVEVTGIFRSNQTQDRCEQTYEAEELMIVSQAEKIAIERNLPPLNVAVNFSIHNRPKKVDRRSIANKLVETVKSSLPAVDIADFYLGPEHGLPSVIESVSVSKNPWTTCPLWQKTLVGFVMDDCEVDLQRTIDDKNPKLVHYKQRCSECWLLIVANWFHGPSAFYEPSDKLIAHSFNTAFDRVYFLELFSGRLLRLGTEVRA